MSASTTAARMSGGARAPRSRSTSCPGNSKPPAAALWLWYRRGVGYALLGVGASLLLLAGPLAQTASPILDAGLEAVHAEPRARRSSSQHEDGVRSAERQLHAALANSQAAPRGAGTSGSPHRCGAAPGR